MVGVGLISSKFLNVTQEGDCSGIWVAESNYNFNPVPNIRIKTKWLFQIWATLNLEFEKGGSFEYKCELIYELDNTVPEPPSVDIFVDIGYNCTKDLEKLFDMTNTITRKSANESIWIPYEQDFIKQLVIEKL